MTKEEYEKLNLGDVIKHEKEGQFMVTYVSDGFPEHVVGIRVLNLPHGELCEEWIVFRKATFETVKPAPKPTLVDRLIAESSKAHVSTIDLKESLMEILREEGIANV